MIAADQNVNQVVWLRNIDRLMRLMLPCDRPLHIWDVGAGAGVAMAYFSEKPKVSAVGGIEIDPDLHWLGNKQLSRLPAFAGYKDVPISLGDATTTCIPPATNIVFLFNPFGKYSASVFLRTNLEVLKSNHAKILIANDHLLPEFLSRGDLVGRDARFRLSVVGFG